MKRVVVSLCAGFVTAGAIAVAAPASAGAEPYYENCTAAWNAGVAPLHRGDPGYASHLDRDGDGVACEKDPR